MPSGTGGLLGAWCHDFCISVGGEMIPFVSVVWSLEKPDEEIMVKCGEKTHDDISTLSSVPASNYMGKTQ